MSEIGVGAALSAIDSTEEQCVEASGYPAPGYEVKIIDPETGREQPIGVAGEIVVRGYMVMQGYYRKPEETAKAVDAEGWLHSGDMGLIRSDGHLRFMGRYKDMLKIGGENVDPLEVEAYLLGHPAISAAAVVGFPDARLSEIAVAFVRPVVGQQITEKEVTDYCRGRIASYKIPRHVFLVDEFPMPFPAWSSSTCSNLRSACRASTSASFQAISANSSATSSRRHVAPASTPWSRSTTPTIANSVRTNATGRFASSISWSWSVKAWDFSNTTASKS